MSNSIRYARSRPRVASVNFRVFSWVLTREAVFNLGDARNATSADRLRWRESLCAMPTWKVEQLGARLIVAGIRRGRL